MIGAGLYALVTYGAAVSIRDRDPEVGPVARFFRAVMWPMALGFVIYGRTLRPEGMRHVVRELARWDAMAAPITGADVIVLLKEAKLVHMGDAAREMKFARDELTPGEIDF